MGLSFCNNIFCNNLVYAANVQIQSVDLLRQCNIAPIIININEVNDI